jgi:hypothetical protein
MFEKVAPYLPNPLVLIGFLLLLFFSVHRTLVRSHILPSVTPSASSRIVQLLLKYGFVIAVLVILLGFGMSAFREFLKSEDVQFHEKAQALRARPLSRVEAEALLQTQRGSIEHCLSQEKWTSLNFVFQPQPSGINVDIFSEVDPDVHYLGHVVIPPGEYNSEKFREALNRASIGGYPDHPPDAKEKKWIQGNVLGGCSETPATHYTSFGDYIAVSGVGEKLSIVAPDSNRCILGAIASSVMQYTTTANELPLIHRYVTDVGVQQAKAEGKPHRN